eukprot:gene7542-biopygen15095
MTFGLLMTDRRLTSIGPVEASIDNRTCPHSPSPPPPPPARSSRPIGPSAAHRPPSAHPAQTQGRHNFWNRGWGGGGAWCGRNSGILRPPSWDPSILKNGGMGSQQEITVFSKQGQWDPGKKVQWWVYAGQGGLQEAPPPPQATHFCLQITPHTGAPQGAALHVSPHVWGGGVRQFGPLCWESLRKRKIKPPSQLRVSTGLGGPIVRSQRVSMDSAPGCRQHGGAHTLGINPLRTEWGGWVHAPPPSPLARRSGGSQNAEIP